MTKLFLIVTFAEELALFHLDTVPDPVLPKGQKPLEDACYNYQSVGVLEGLRRYKTKDRASLGKLLAKHFPNAVEQTINPPATEQELINRMMDQGEVYVIDLTDRYIRVDTGRRINEQGEHINKDGIPTREINCITGVPYPKPPEGMQRYVVSIIYDGGASYCDVHKMVMAASPRDACLQEIAYHDSPENPMRQNEIAWAIFGGRKVLQAFARDFDSEGTTFFNGPNCDESAEMKAMTTMFNRAVGMGDNFDQSKMVEGFEDLLGDDFADFR